MFLLFNHPLVKLEVPVRSTPPAASPPKRLHLKARHLEQEALIGVYEGPDVLNMLVRLVEADAVVKGQTAASSAKPAVLENGIRTTVPPHIETGTLVVINTEDGSYVERAKN